MQKASFIFIVVLFLSIQLTAQTGIGTTSPINKFQVETSAAAPLTTGTGFNGNLRLGATGANQVLDFGLGTTYGWIQSRDKTGYGTNYILALNPNGGNVGINKSAPTKALDVTGDVGVSGNLTGGNVAASSFFGFAANFNNISSGTTYTLLSSDNGKILNINVTSAFTITIPSGLPVGFNCTIIQYGTGQIIFAASSTTLKNRNNFTKSAGQYSAITVLNMGSEVYIISGEMSN